MFEKIRRAAQRAALIFKGDGAPARVRENELMLAASAQPPKAPKAKRVSKYMPHQGEREKARRRRQMGIDWMDV